jgi:hypothetical protein
MNAGIDLACTVCSEDFVVAAETYQAHSSVVECPCCGSTDLVLLRWDKDETSRLGDAA